MNAILRHLAVLPTSLICGPSYAILQYLIRSPKPLDSDWVWNEANRQYPAVADWMRRNYPPVWLRRLFLWWKLRQPHHVGIEDHYDVSNAFYQLILDKEYLFYTCADFLPGDTLQQAQIRKADFLLNLIQPNPGEKILDLGCGWGGMMRRIVESTGDKENILGFTLSKAQEAFIKERFGLRVELKNFITCDYPTNTYDKIYSIGAWEHVRHADVDITLRKLYQALKPNGRLVHHFFTNLTERVPTSMVVGQIFFPGSLPPSYPWQVQAFERAGFRIAHRSIHDYRPTLKAWFDNLVANREKAIALVGVEVYNRYVVFFAAAHRFFADGDAMLVRYVLEKS